MKGTYDLIIFDCDGVLVDSERIAHTILSEELGALGIQISEKELTERFAGTTFAKVRAFIEEQTGEPTPEFFETRYRERATIAFQRDLTAIEGVEDLIQSLEVPKAVGSNGPMHKIIPNLTVTKLKHYFEPHIYSAYDFKIWKPDPRFYAGIAKIMGVSPDRTIVIEDSPAGVRSAHTAGIRVFGYAGTHKPELLAAEGAIVVHQMQEIKALLTN